MKTKTEILSDAVERLVGDGLSTHGEVMTHTLEELGRVYESGYVAGYAARQFGDVVRADEKSKARVRRGGK